MVTPKGIQEKTLETIMEYLTKHSGEWLTGEAIADGVNIRLLLSDDICLIFLTQVRFLEIWITKQAADRV